VNKGLLKKIGVVFAGVVVAAVLLGYIIYVLHWSNGKW
jgi:hypothetical protein